MVLTVNTKPEAVVRFSFLDRLWYVCHARSYQNAIRYPANGKQTRAEAVVLAEANGFTVVRHADDNAQKSD
jgi:hypothetical protein